MQMQYFPTFVKFIFYVHVCMCVCRDKLGLLHSIPGNSLSWCIIVLKCQGSLCWNLLYRFHVLFFVVLHSSRMLMPHFPAVAIPSCCTDCKGAALIVLRCSLNLMYSWLRLLGKGHIKEWDPILLICCAKSLALEASVLFDSNRSVQFIFSCGCSLTAYWVAVYCKQYKDGSHASFWWNAGLNVSMLNFDFLY